MRLIDADKLLGFLIYSKHIDSLTCKEVKEAVEMCKVDVLEQKTDLNEAVRIAYEQGRQDALEEVRAEIERLHYHPKLDFIKNDEVVDMALDIIDKYKGDKE